MAKEKWRQIKDYEGRYWISDLGRVKNSDGHIIKQKINPSGYMQAPLFDGDGYKRKLVHRLVAFAFINKPRNYAEVNHIDGDKTNNRAENLQWTTKSKNHLHRVYVLGKTSKHPKKVKCVETGQIFLSVSMATRAMKLKNPISISAAAHDKQKTAGGCHWVFV